MVCCTWRLLARYACVLAVVCCLGFGLVKLPGVLWLSGFVVRWFVILTVG